MDGYLLFAAMHQRRRNDGLGRPRDGLCVKSSTHELILLLLLKRWRVRRMLHGFVPRVVVLEEMTRGIRLLLWLLLLLYKWVMEMGVVVDQTRLEMLHLHPRIMRLQALAGMRHPQRCPKMHPHFRCV